jgi:site-specific DNA-methyltransferase (adenine-specific)
MTGIFHIVVARKPIEGTIVENCLQWGCGAINIDGCRVKGTKGTGVWGMSNQTINRDRKFNASPGMGEYRSEAMLAEDGKVGRFPANLMLGHSVDCFYRPGEQKGEVEPGYCHADEDSKETVEVWECVADCAVKTMGKQSGEKKAGVAIRKNGASGFSGGLYGGGNLGAGKDYGFNDSGSASRFFFNFAEQESDE